MENKEEIVEKLKGKQKFYVLSYDRGIIYINDLYAEDRDEAYEMVDEEATNLSSDWVLEPEEFEELKKKIKEYENSKQ